MAHSSLLRQALTEFADRPLLILPDESNIDAGGRWEATPGTVQPSKYSHGEYSHCAHWHTKRECLACAPRWHPIGRHRTAAAGGGRCAAARPPSPRRAARCVQRDAARRVRPAAHDALPYAAARVRPRQRARALPAALPQPRRGPLPTPAAQALHVVHVCTCMCTCMCMCCALHTHCIHCTRTLYTLRPLP